MFNEFISRFNTSIKRNGLVYTISNIPQKLMKQKSALNFHRASELNKILDKCKPLPQPVSLISNYPVDLNIIDKTKSLNALCFGIFDDVQFELAIHDLGFNVFSCDPTPITLKMFEDKPELKKKITHHAFGVWTEDGIIKFYQTAATEAAPEKEYSIVNIDSSAHCLEMNCKKISTIINDLNLKSIDYMKLDIEGAVPAVLNSFLTENKDKNLTPKQISFELEFPRNSKSESFKSMIEISLKLMGIMEQKYELYYVPKQDLFSQLIIYARAK
jgi:FkbM family methyltransferase